MARTLTKADRRRVWPKVVVRMNVACQSSRNGAAPALIVLHSTEGHNRPGKSDLQGLGSFFDRLSTQASSTVAIDADETSARYVPDSRKAWTQAFWNPVCLSIEQVGTAGMKWSDAEVREAARWIAVWSRRHNIPIRVGKVDNARGIILRTGVVSHKMLGQRGGGHVDPGPYPWKAVLRWARIYKVLQLDRLKRL